MDPILCTSRLVDAIAVILRPDRVGRDQQVLRAFLLLEFCWAKVDLAITWDG